MKVLIYINEEKDKDLSIKERLCSALKKNNVEYTVYEKEKVSSYNGYNAIFVIGGDGTLLRRTSFVIDKNIPIIGINAGKLGFLSEFAPENIDQCVELFVKNKLKKDVRNVLEIEYRNKKFYALNDVVLQRGYIEGHGMTTEIQVSIDSNVTDIINGDGIIVATPTGSTAYSLSAGGAILAPNVNAFIITPIAAHSFGERSIVYSSDSVCELKYLNCSTPMLFIDGKYIETLKNNENIVIKSSKETVTFLRLNNYNFYNRLSEKLKDRAGEKQ